MTPTHSDSFHVTPCKDEFASAIGQKKRGGGMTVGEIMFLTIYGFFIDTASSFIFNSCRLYVGHAEVSCEVSHLLLMDV